MANIERKRGATSKEPKLPLDMRDSKGRDSRSDILNFRYLHYDALTVARFQF